MFRGQNLDNNTRCAEAVFHSNCNGTGPHISTDSDFNASCEGTVAHISTDSHFNADFSTDTYSGHCQDAC